MDIMMQNRKERLKKKHTYSEVESYLHCCCKLLNYKFVAVQVYNFFLMPSYLCAPVL